MASAARQQIIGGAPIIKNWRRRGQYRALGSLKQIFAFPVCMQTIPTRLYYSTNILFEA